MESKKYRLEIIKFVVQVATAICVVITLLLSIYPKMKPNNSNLEEMANAGDIDSQLRLADMYYATGDFAKSLYWYDVSLLYEDNDGDILAIYKKQHEGSINRNMILQQTGYPSIDKPWLKFYSIGFMDEIKIAKTVYQYVEDKLD